HSTGGAQLGSRRAPRTVRPRDRGAQLAPSPRLKRVPASGRRPAGRPTDGSASPVRYRECAARLLASFCLGGCGWRAKLVATGLAHATAAWRCVPYQRRLCLFRAYRRHRRLRIGSWAWRLFTVSSIVACHAGQLFLFTNTLSCPAMSIFHHTTLYLAAG